MKKILLIATLLFMITPLMAQKYQSHDGLISFYSNAPLEDITATNKKVSAAFNTSTGEIAFTLNMKDFQFKKKLMQEHFNEKYVESDKFPKSTFTGLITGFDSSKKTTQQVQAKGKLNIHGVTQEIDVPGTIHNSGKIRMKSTFKVKVADYNIKIPQLLWQNIAEEVEVTVDLTFK